MRSQFVVASAKSAAKVLQKNGMCKKNVKNTTNLVKKHHSYWFFVIALLISVTSNARVNNYIGAYANLGEWSFLPSQSDYKASLGVAGGAGFLYELQAGSKYSQTRFLLDIGVGAVGGMTSYSQTSNAEAVLKDQLDLDSELFDYVYEVSDRKDQYKDLAVQVPVMIGVQHKKFYMLAGVKIYSHVLTKSYSTAMLTTYGRYAAFDDFRDMPEYQFFSGLQYPLDGKAKGVKTSLKLDMDASLELGLRLGYVPDAVGFDVPKRKIEYRIAAFADYGLLDVHYKRDQLAVGALNADGHVVPLSNMGYNTGATAPVYNTKTMVDNLVMNDIMTTSGFADKVTNLLVGIKFTVLFQLPEPRQCLICRDAYIGSTPRSGGSRGMKYEE